MLQNFVAVTCRSLFSTRVAIHTKGVGDDRFSLLHLWSFISSDRAQETLQDEHRTSRVGIVGSYRKHGTIDTAVTAVLEAAQAAGANTEKIYLQDQNIEFCTNCRMCLQHPGPERGQCVLDDDMQRLLACLEAADAFVIGSPVNFGNVNALTQRFIERCVCYGYWPWEQHTPTPRKTELTKKAVLISSSAAPSLLARWLTRSLKTLKQASQLLNAKTIGTLWVGMIDPLNPKLPDRVQHRAQKLGQRLAA